MPSQAPRAARQSPRRLVSLVLLLLSCFASALLPTTATAADPAAASDEPSSPSVAGTASDPCAAGRYLLYSVQRGEGFSLRRDALVRIGAALNMSTVHGAAHGRWTLVLPPLSSRLSPHWHQGLPHAGVAYMERSIPYASLWDMEHLSQQTGLRFLEYADFVEEQVAARAPIVSPGSDVAIGQVEQVLHLCSFAFNAAFHEASAKAGRDGHPPAFPGSSFPRSYVFREFGCMRGERPSKDVGHCGTPLPEVREQKGGPARMMTSEYGELGLPRGKLDTVHCGMANLQPNVLPAILDEYMSPQLNLTAGSGSAASTKPVCSALLTNTQLMYWPPAPSRWTPENDPTRLLHNARQLFLRSWRLAPPLLALAHAFIQHELQASPALPLDSAAARALLAADDSAQSSLPPYLSFHVRRGDFKHVHADQIPQLDHLAHQIVLRFRSEWDRLRSNSSMPPSGTPAAAPLLSSRVFISSDMDTNEFAELERLLVVEQANPLASPTPTADAASSSSASSYPLVTLVRFDLLQVRRAAVQWSPALRAYMDAADAAAQAVHSSPPLHPAVKRDASAVVPLTPFHVLLLDQLMCELSLRERGFVGTRTSYVSEMIWQQRRALGLEDDSKWKKDVLQPGAKPSTDDARAAKAKDEL